MNEPEHYLKKGSVAGMLLAVVVASGFVVFNIFPCRGVVRNHPEAYFADHVNGSSGNYCQLIVKESSKEYADKQMNLFSGGKGVGNGYRSISSYLILKTLYIGSFAVIGLIAGGVVGFMIERKKKQK